MPPGTQTGRGPRGVNLSRHVSFPSQDAFEAQLVQIYDLYRDALLSKLYYENRLELLQRLNTLSELALSLATGSFAGLAIWQGPAGKPIFMYLTFASVTLSVVRSVLQWPKRIATLSKLVIGYTDLYFDLQQVVQEIPTHEDLTPELRRKFLHARERFSKLAIQEPKPVERIVAKCKLSVLQKITVESLWLPPKRTL